MVQQYVRVWDPLVRIFHWSLVAAFSVAYLSGGEQSALHVNSGYVVLGLVLFRILWGVVGSRYARFSEFLYPPATVLAYARDFLSRHPRRYLGHNPLGGMMVVAMLLALLATTGSGLMVYAIEEKAGPLAGWVADAGRFAPVTPARANGEDEEEGDEARHGGGDEAAEAYWEEIHEGATQLTLLLILLHVLGVVAGTLHHGEKLVQAMFTGNKPLPPP